MNKNSSSQLGKAEICDYTTMLYNFYLIHNVEVVSTVSKQLTLTMF